MLRLREFIAADQAELISWVPTPEDLRLFTGSSEPWPLTLELLTERAELEHIRAWTAVLQEDSSEPVGHVEHVITGPDSARLARVLIAPSHRGRGLAGHLIKAAIETASGLGVATLSLNVVQGNEAAIRSYQRAGFVLVGNNSEHPEYLQMERDIRQVASAGESPSLATG